MNEIKTCEWCGDEFSAFRSSQKFCCKNCSHQADLLRKRWRRQAQKKVYDEQTCIVCGMKFIPRTKVQVTCGGECSYKHVINSNYDRKIAKTLANKKVLEVRKCLVCNKEFNPTTYRQVLCGDPECKKTRARETALKNPKKPKKYVPKKKSGPSLAEFERMAREQGLSYGDLEAKLNGGAICQNIARRA